MYGGEDFDARLVPTSWNQAAFDDAKWTNAVVTSGPGGALRGFSYAAPPLRAHETLKPVAINPLGSGAMVYDLGQNASLMPRLRVRGPAGAVVKIIPSELLKSDGTLDRASCGGQRGAEAYWSYTLDGSGNEEWFPKFFYHGCRYLEVELTAPSGQPLPEILSLEGVVVNSDSAPAGDFACSNELFNRIRTLVRWAQRSNTVSVLTDCPHRERLGWQEQYHLNGPALRYEYDLTQLYSKTFGDMADAQQPNGLLTDTAPEYVIFSDGFRDSPEWGSALILAAWQHWQWTGDDLPLRRHYDAMRRYVDYLSSRADGHLISFGLGDWYDLGPKKPGRSQLTPIALTASAFYYIDTTTLASIAVHLGETNDSIHYGTQAAAIRTAFNHAFFNDVTGSYATGSQCANALPLVAGLVAPEHADAVLAALVSDVHAHGDSLTAGDVGYRYLLRALAHGGRSDVIFAMNNQSEKPGYGYQLAHGCTSLAEAWNAEPASSQDHFMLGQITEWFYHDLAGLGAEAESPGFKRVVIRPRPVPGVTWARATHESPRGPILSSWKIADHKLTLEVAVPPNATATVYIPAADPEKVREGEKKARKSPGVRWLRNEVGCAVFAVESGHFVFTAPAAIQPEPGMGGTR
jgi:alpha-L-rhamnosidase